MNPTERQGKNRRDTASASPRERLLAAADELFYAEGVHTVGIDRVIEHAGVAKASLYRLFGSKEELVGAYLAVRHERTLQALRDATARHTEPHRAILAVFDAQARWLRRRTYRGCAFARATAESGVGMHAQLATDTYRAAILALFLDLARRTGARDPEMLAAQLHTLFHGADTVLSSPRRGKIIDATRAAVLTLLDAA